MEYLQEEKQNLIDIDKLFENLGYEKISRYTYFIEYRNGDSYISFCLNNKTVSSYEKCLGHFIYREITVEELKLINLKINELGWI